MRVKLKTEQARFVPASMLAGGALLFMCAWVGTRPGPELPRFAVEVTVAPVIDPDRLAALCIFAEARGEEWGGQVAVGNVIRNRMARRYFSDGTVAGTIFKPLQFSWANAYDPQRVRVFETDDTDPAYVVAMSAWKASADSRPGGDALLYHAEYVKPSWATADSVRLVRQVGRHLFYEVVKG